MEDTLKEIRQIVSEVLAEAKKKKEKSDRLKKKVDPPAYSYAEAFDFSAPLGAYNLYRTQGAVNWGPMTSAGTKIDDHILGQRAEAEGALRAYVREAIKSDSSWQSLSEAMNPSVPENVWEAAMFVCERLENEPKKEPVEEKKIGFKQLAQKLAHKKGVKDPKALAAHIGREKYGAAGMAKKSAAGKK